MNVENIDIGKLLEPYLPRIEYNEAEIKELAQSIKDKGLEQNIGLNITPKGLKPIYGTRRLEALKYLGIKTIPCKSNPSTIELSDFKLYQVSVREAIDMALTENLQRKEMTPYEEALGFKTLKEESVSKEQLYEKYKRRYVEQRLTLLEKLSPSLVQCTKYGTGNSNIDKKLLTFSKAREIWNLSHKDQEVIYNVIKHKGLTITQLKLLVSELKLKRRYLDCPSLDADCEMRRLELRKKYYDSPNIFKISLEEIKEDVQTHSSSRKEMLQEMKKRQIERHMEFIKLPLYKYNENGFIEISIGFEGFNRAVKEYEAQKFGMCVGTVYITNYKIADNIPNKKKLEKHGYILIKNKIKKVYNDKE